MAMKLRITLSGKIKKTFHKYGNYTRRGEEMKRQKSKSKKVIPLLLKVMVVVVAVSTFITFFARFPVTNSYFTYWVKSEPQEFEY